MNLLVDLEFSSLCIRREVVQLQTSAATYAFTDMKRTNESLDRLKADTKYLY